MAANTKGTTAPTPNTIRIVQHNCNRSSNVILTILFIAERTADIVLLQEPGFSGPAYATTHPNFELLIPPKNNRKFSRTATYISKSNPYLTVSPRADLSDDPDLQIIEVSTPTIPTTTSAKSWKMTPGGGGATVRSSTQPTAASPKHPIFGRDDFTASDAKQIKFFNAVCR